MWRPYVPTKELREAIKMMMFLGSSTFSSTWGYSLKYLSWNSFVFRHLAEAGTFSLFWFDTIYYCSFYYHILFSVFILILSFQETQIALLTSTVSDAYNFFVFLSVSPLVSHPQSSMILTNASYMLYFQILCDFSAP